MKAVAVFPESQQVKIIEQDVPRLSQPDQVLLRLLDVGICGTDKEICSFEYGTPPAGHDHLVIGHESLAEIVQVGSAVERLRVGDLVVPSVRRPCPRRSCLSCRSGHQDLVYEAVGHSHFALQALQVLGTNGIFVITGVPGLQAFVEADPARLMRDMVLRNQVLLGTVNAGPEAFAAALRDLDAFRRRWPAVVGTLIAGRYPPEQAPDLILGRPAGIKSVITFDAPA